MQCYQVIKTLNSMHYVVRPNFVKIVEHIFSNVQVNWENTYQLPFLYTRETKLRVFQFKFLHRRVATNDFLLNIGKKETDSCSFYAGSPETLTHRFWHCR